MEGLIEAFHIDARLMIAQGFNFAIVLFILYFFALKPLIRKMEERSAKIEEGLKNASEMDARIAGLEKEREEVIAEARKEGLALVAEMKAQAEKEREQTKAKAQSEVEALLVDAKAGIANMREEMIADVKDEAAVIVADVTKKVLADVMTADVDAKLIKKHLEGLK
jgi:F-type H+-transporting ATPase subunit b